jgi:hypothetical protein
LVCEGEVRGEFNDAFDPSLRFLALLRAAIADGKAHLANRGGGAPEWPERWGWHKLRGRSWVPQGTRIGWVVANDLYIDPAISYEVAQ